jgi:Na+/H+ antiporter NhaC
VHLFADTLWQDVLGGLSLDSGSTFKLRIILFVVFLFMAIGVMGRAGGILGMVDRIARFARGPLRAQLSAWLCGLLIFFDDYTNCIVVGTTMQPVTDRNRVSREKLAYIVDSTAAPLAGLSVFSTWIAYEVSQYQAALTQVTRPDGTPYVAADAFAVFMQTLPFRFYCIFALVLVGLTIVLRRELGPMLQAERRARSGQPAPGAAADAPGLTASLEPPAGTAPRAVNALLPLLVLLGLSLWLIFRYGAYGPDGWRVPDPVQGFVPRAQWILGNSATDKALMWGSLAALGLAAALALSQRILGPGQVIRSALRSARTLAVPLMILLLAWALGQTCEDLGTSFFLCAGFRDLMSAQALPLLMFGLSGLIAFATGTSFGTMAILLPNVVVLAHTLGEDSGLGGSVLMVLTIGAVLEGSIFGDHCSPISDTTVLSSLGSRCDHLAHVQTQFPYAMLAMAAAAVCGYLPMVLFGPGWWPLAFVSGIAAMAAVLWLVGRPVGGVGGVEPIDAGGTPS